MGKALLLEKLTFCKFADDFDFENYFRIKELTESELLCLASFFHYHECYLMLLDVMNHHKEKFAFTEDSLLQELEVDDVFMERISRIDALSVT